MSGLDPIIKTIFGNTISIILRVVGFTLFGIFLNIALMVVQWKNIVSTFSITGSPEDIALGSSLILAITLFPVAYFLLGQKQAVQNLLSNLLKTKKYETVYWLVNKLYEIRPELFSSDGKIQLTSLKVTEYLSEILRDLPGVVVKSMRYLIAKVGFSGKFVTALNELKTAEVREPSYKVEKVSKILSNMIPGDVIKPDIKLPLAIFVFNMSFFFY